MMDQLSRRSRVPLLGMLLVIIYLHYYLFNNIYLLMIYRSAMGQTMVPGGLEGALRFGITRSILSSIFYYPFFIIGKMRLIFM